MQTIKSALFSVLALATACSQSSNDEFLSNTQTQDARIAINQTKATYDNDLKAVWEIADRLDIVQKALNGKVSTLVNSAGNTSIFTGQVSIPSSLNKVFCLAYPSGSLAISGETVTCTFTLPSIQSGKWIPYLYHQTEAIAPSALSSMEINFGATQGSALAIRVYNKNKDLAKEIQTINITAQNNLIGTITNGIVSATGKTITLDNNAVPTTGTLNNVEYTEYRFNVLPVAAGTLTIELNDGVRTVTAKTESNVTFTANKRTGLNIMWPTEDNDVTVTASFDDAADNGWTEIYSEQN